MRPEKDGTLTIGLDELADHLIGHPDSVQLPAKGSEIESNGIAWRMMKNGHEIQCARRWTAQWWPRAEMRMDGI